MLKNLKFIFCIIFLLAISSVAISAQTSLKEVFKDYFLIGAAMNRAQFSENDKKSAEIVKTQFNTISPENALKWESVHPQPNKYDFKAADRFVEFGEKNKMFTVGHALVWHNQTPDWVFKDEKGNLVGRDELLKRMREHIKTVVGRYKGRIKGWDVVNEALNDDGTMRESLWYKIIGEDFIEKAFEYAHEADSKAELYYNDYSLELPAKRQTAIRVIKNLLAKKIPITAVGSQSHDNLNFPSLDEQEKTITEFAALGIKVNISEFDISVLPDPEGFTGAEVTLDFEMKEKLNPYKNALPKEIEEKQATRYAELFKIFLKYHKHIDRVTFWNVTDKESWLNNFPVRGRTNYPLIFNRNGNKKLAFDAIMKTAKEFSGK